MFLAALTLAAQLQAALTVFEHARPAVEQRVGAGQAIDLAMRLINDQQYVDMPVPEGYAKSDWDETVQAIITSDVQAIDDLAAGTIRPLGFNQRGLFETFVRSHRDGVLVPIAVYVPVTASTNSPLAVVLHGNPQTESELLGPPFFRRLADRTGTILIAPWGRGAYDYEGVGKDDVYDALAAAQRAFRTDPKRCFLVGYSMGGFSVFKIGPGNTRWSAVMDIAGALLNSEVSIVRFAWRDTPIYVVTGKQDQVIPAVYGEETATYLASLDIPTGFYEQMDGKHQLRTLVPALADAWMDMHSGTIRATAVVRPASGRFAPLTILQPTKDLKP